MQEEKIIKVLAFLSISLMFLMVMFACYLYLFFDLRHTQNFAVSELQQRGFTEISILEKQLLSTRQQACPLTMPTKNRFEFVAVKQGEKVRGALICSRLFFDIKKSRCELE